MFVTVKKENHIKEAWLYAESRYNYEPPQI